MEKVKKYTRKKSCKSSQSGKILHTTNGKFVLCEPLRRYCKRNQANQLNLFANQDVDTEEQDIRVVELFAGVGGFRIGLERASKHFVTVWNNQWEPSTKRQDASFVYCKQFGNLGHSNVDISTVSTVDIPECNLLVGGFPCQDYSVATTLKHSGGIEGKKGVLWWQIYRILKESEHKPNYLFLENVDRLLKSPASQRGRDFAIILASLSDLGYCVEWRIINAADYGMPQRRRRVYIVAYHKDSPIYDRMRMETFQDWILEKGVIAKAFPLHPKGHVEEFDIIGTIEEVSNHFDSTRNKTVFLGAGIMDDRHVVTMDFMPVYNGIRVNLGDLLIEEKDVPQEFFIDENDIKTWEYLKGGKSEKRVNKKLGYEYKYSEGPMAFPDYLDCPSRTIITGEGGKSASRFKHVVRTPSGRLRRLVPIELERLNMFPDNHTQGVGDGRRAFLMGNALVTGVIEKIGIMLYNFNR